MTDLTEYTTRGRFGVVPGQRYASVSVPSTTFTVVARVICSPPKWVVVDDSAHAEVVEEETLVFGSLLVSDQPRRNRLGQPGSSEPGSDGDAPEISPSSTRASGGS